MNRKVQMLISAGVVIGAAATVWALVSGWSWAWLPAAVAGILFVMASCMALIDRGVRRRSALPLMDAEQRDAEVLAAQQRVGLKSGLTIVVGLAAIALVVASAVLNPAVVAIGALLVFAMMAFIGLPFWLAMIEEEVEAERSRLLGEEPAGH